MRSIIQTIETYPISPTRLIKSHHVNRTNETLLTMAIRKATRKRYIKSVIKMLTHIQRASIYPLNRKARRFNTQIKDLTRWMLILLGLRLYVGNVKLLFPQSPDSTNTLKTAVLGPSSPCCLVPLSQPRPSLLSFQDPWF